MIPFYLLGLLTIISFEVDAHLLTLDTVYRIRRIRKFWGLPDPDPVVSERYGSGLGSGSFHSQAKIVRKNLDFHCFVTSL